MPMPVGGRLGRSSRFIVEYDYRDGLDRNGLPNFRSGQIPSYARGGTVNSATAVDRNGRVYVAGPSQPRFHHQYNPATGLHEPVGLLLEGLGKNLVVQSDALTAANGWTVGALTTEAAYAKYAGRPFTRVSNLGAADIYRGVTFTGNAVKAFSQLVRYDGAAAGYTTAIYDDTVGAYRLSVILTFSASGVLTAVASTGSLPRVESLGDRVYRLHMQTTAITAANTHRVIPLGNVTSGSSVLMSGLMAEDASFPSSLIPTTTGTVTRAADILSSPFNAPPQAMTWYQKFTDAGNAARAVASATTTLGFLGAAGGAGLGNAAIWFDFPNGKAQFNHYNGAATAKSTQTATAPSAGDEIEVWGLLYDDGSVQLVYSINGATEVVCDRSAANPLAATWGGGSASLWNIYPTAGADNYPSVAESFLRIAAGVRATDYMRAGN